MRWVAGLLQAAFDALKTTEARFWQVANTADRELSEGCTPSFKDRFELSIEFFSM